MKLNNKLQTGQLAIYSLIFLAAVMILASSLFTRTANFLRLGGNRLRSEQATNLAEAGVDYAIWQLNETSGGFSSALRIPLGGGEFSVTVPPGPSREITATGYIPDAASPRNKQEIKVMATNISTVTQEGTPSSISCTIPSFSSNPCVWSHTVPPGLSDSRLIVGISVRGTTPVNYVTYGSTGGAVNCPAAGGLGDLTQITFANNPTHVRTEMWYLANPPAGSFDICVHMNTSASILYVAAGASTWRGVAGFGAVNTDSGFFIPSVSLGGPLGYNDVAIDSLGVQGGDTVDPDSFQPQIEIYEQNITLPAPGQVTGAASYIANSPLSTTTLWTPGGNAWAGIAVILQPGTSSWKIKKGTYRFSN